MIVAATMNSVYADELTMLGVYQRHDIRVTSICVEGHVVVAAHSDVGQGGGLHMLQLQHLVDGEIVPMRCGDKRIAETKTAPDVEAGAAKKSIAP